MTQDQADPTKKQTPWLVIGMGSIASGKEQRAVTALKHMPRIKPYFLTSQWEDGTVSHLLRENGFEFTATSFGYLGRARVRWTLLNIRLMPGLFSTMLRTYRAQRTQGILVLALSSFTNALPAILLLRYFCGAHLVFYLGDVPANTVPNRAVYQIMRWVSDAIIVNSQAVQRGLSRMGIPEDRMTVVYNGKELEKYRDAEPLPFRAQWPANSLLVGYAGQFAVNKGVGDFLHAAERVLQQTDECRFVMIGLKDESNLCYRELCEYVGEKNLADKFAFPGWLPKMECAYAALDIVVVPSRISDASPNVILEAMASGLPVIGTRIGGIPELIAHGETGFLVEPNAPERIAELILQLLRNPDLRRTMGLLGKEQARDRFDARKNAQLIENILNNA